MENKKRKSRKGNGERFGSTAAYVGEEGKEGAKKNSSLRTEEKYCNTCQRAERRKSKNGPQGGSTRGIVAYGVHLEGMPAPPQSGSYEGLFVERQRRLWLREASPSVVEKERDAKNRLKPQQLPCLVERTEG